MTDDLPPYPLNSANGPEGEHPLSWRRPPALYSAHFDELLSVMEDGLAARVAAFRKLADLYLDQRENPDLPEPTIELGGKMASVPWFVVGEICTRSEEHLNRTRVAIARFKGEV